MARVEIVKPPDFGEGMGNGIQNGDGECDGTGKGCGRADGANDEDCEGSYGDGPSYVLRGDGEGDVEGEGFGNGNCDGSGDAEGNSEGDLLTYLERSDPNQMPISLLMKKIRASFAEWLKYEEMGTPEIMRLIQLRRIDTLRGALNARKPQLALINTIELKESLCDFLESDLPTSEHEAAAECYAEYIFGLDCLRLRKVMEHHLIRYFFERGCLDVMTYTSIRDNDLTDDHREAADKYARHVFGMKHGRLSCLMGYCYEIYADEIGFTGDIATAPKQSPSIAIHPRLSEIHMKVAEKYANYSYGMHHLRARMLMNQLNLTYVELVD